MSKSEVTLKPGLRRGAVTLPFSKSIDHRLLIASFLAGNREKITPSVFDPEDISATKRCLAALATNEVKPVLDCGESASTLRFLSPVAAALGKSPVFVKSGRLAERPNIEYANIFPGDHFVRGDISSQYITGLLFALPLLDGDSTILFTSEVMSKGYIDLTVKILKSAGIEILPEKGGYFIKGAQQYHEPNYNPEGDWSSKVVYLVMNALGSEIEINNAPSNESLQPDRLSVAVIEGLLKKTKEKVLVNISQFPDSFPALAVLAASVDQEVTFDGINRLRTKESDRVAAMCALLASLGKNCVDGGDCFTIFGATNPFVTSGIIRTHSDHRIAMAAVIAATRSSTPIIIDDGHCTRKSYPTFINDFLSLDIKK